ncbi:MAG: hypothetical protein KDK07_24930 [Bauldia sp.]|nr:hypothetical protein [Bauldia sp.]
MTETETEEGGKAAPKRTPGKRARPPVTIDLAAEAAPPAAESPDAKSSAPAEDASSAKAAPPPSEPPPAAPGLTMTAGADQEPKAAADRTRPSAEPRPEAASSPSVVTAPGPVSPFPPRIERPKTDWSSAGRLIAAGVFGGAIATVLGILYHASGIIPTRADLVAADAVRKAEAVEERVARFETRLAALETATAPLPALSEKVTSLEKLEETNRSRIENLENAMPVAGGGSGEGTVIALGPIESRLAATETTLTTLGTRLDTLTSRVDELATRPPPAVESERAARAIAIGLLRQGAASGESFAVDLAMLKALGLDGDDVAALEPLAKRGAPTVPQLQSTFPPVADAILAATADVDPDAGFIDRLVAFGSGLVSIRPTTPIAGDTPEAIVSRMQAAVDDADLAAALDERQKLPEAGQAVSATWAASASDRTQIDDIVQRLALSVAPPAN